MIWTDFNAYVSWAIYAVSGMMNEADAVLHERESAVYACARHQHAVAPITARTLYRGLVLEPSLVADGRLAPDHRTFLSFTESRDVAFYFADRYTTMGALIRRQRPDARGYIMEHTPEIEDVLWHHSWTAITALDGRKLGLVQAASVHPHFDRERRRQLDWNMRSQREVILKRASHALPIQLYANQIATRSLDARYTPPWLRDAMHANG